MPLVRISDLSLDKGAVQSPTVVGAMVYAADVETVAAQSDTEQSFQPIFNFFKYHYVNVVRIIGQFALSEW